MTTKLLLAFLAVCAGIAASLQSAANGRLAQRIGLGATMVINTAIVLVGSLGLFVARGPHADFFPAGTPWAEYTGGVCGFVIVFGLALAFPGIGAVLTIALVVLGQSVTALAIDHYGLLGMPKDPVSISRLAGLVLVAGGVALIRS
jgi:transporter family-2 protein